jgi:hypothetical protein
MLPDRLELRQLPLFKADLQELPRVWEHLICSKDKGDEALKVAAVLCLTRFQAHESEGLRVAGLRLGASEPAEKTATCVQHCLLATVQHTVHPGHQTNEPLLVLSRANKA